MRKSVFPELAIAYYLKPGNDLVFAFVTTPCPLLGEALHLLPTKPFGKRPEF
jgi:hypothetical protein